MASIISSYNSYHVLRFLFIHAMLYRLLALAFYILCFNIIACTYVLDRLTHPFSSDVHQHSKTCEVGARTLHLHRPALSPHHLLCHHVAPGPAAPTSTVTKTNNDIIMTSSCDVTTKHIITSLINSIYTICLSWFSVCHIHTALTRPRTPRRNIAIPHQLSQTSKGQRSGKRGRVAKLEL